LAFLKNKRIVFAAILALAIAASSFWIFRKPENEKVALEANTVTVLDKKPAGETPDSDSDGLKDWEERLWGTDPNNQDTDNDGTTDGEEIKLGRDPLNPGPDDYVSPSVTSNDNGVSPEELNLTQKTTRDLFVSYIQQRQAGLDPSSASEGIVNSVLNNAGAPEFKNNFSQKDIKTVDNASLTENKFYINELARISGEGGEKIKENELNSLERAINLANSSDSFEKFGEFAGNAAVYKKMTADILKMSVPRNYALSHLRYLNALNNLSEINLAFSTFMSDPISGLSAVRQYLDEADNIKNSLIVLSVSIYADRLVFGPEEYGFAFLNLINQLQ